MHGFKPSNVICLYTDDCCIFAKDSTTIHHLISNLSDDFLLKDEGSIEDFLGVRINTTTDHEGAPIITMTQIGLINDILTDLGLHMPLTKYEKHSTPATEVLQSHSDKPAFNEPWSYRSLIGKLNFLAQNTQPDISFAVHQCAKYCNNPRHSHGIAVKRIGKYLKTTADKGLILCPDNTHQLNAYVD